MIPRVPIPPAAADAVSSSSTPDLSSATESTKGAASDLKAKAKSVLKGNSGLPNSIGTVADLNANVRGTAESYSDPAIAPVQDKIQGELGSGGVWGLSSMSSRVVSRWPIWCRTTAELLSIASTSSPVPHILAALPLQLQHGITRRGYISSVQSLRCNL